MAVKQLATKISFAVAKCQEALAPFDEVRNIVIVEGDEEKAELYRQILLVRAALTRIQELVSAHQSGTYRIKRSA